MLIPQRLRSSKESTIGDAIWNNTNIHALDLFDGTPVGTM
ncbi:hypothetical protein ACP70R_019375 [Stipagrostis hirtigluma subsp. patula]